MSDEDMALAAAYQDDPEMFAAMMMSR